MTDEGARENAFGGSGYAGPPAHLISSVLPLVAGHTDALRHFHMTYLNVLRAVDVHSVQAVCCLWRIGICDFTLDSIRVLPLECWLIAARAPPSVARLCGTPTLSSPLGGLK